jgi:hypothetical protein
MFPSTSRSLVSRNGSSWWRITDYWLGLQRTAKDALSAFEGKHVAAILGPSCLLVSANAVGPFLSVTF